MFAQERRPVKELRHSSPQAVEREGLAGRKHRRVANHPEIYARLKSH
jgi:hypothetical protein